MQRPWARKTLAFLGFALVMLVMCLATLLVLVFFVPFVGLKALWVLVLRPSARRLQGGAQEA